MYIETVPNRNSPPAILLREGWREGNKTLKRTLANLSDWPKEKIETFRRLLRDETLVSPQDLLATQNTLPHGHVEAVLLAIRKLGLDAMISAPRCRERDLVLAMIVERLLDPCSKLATTRPWHSTTLAEELGVSEASEDELYQAMDWLLERQPRIEKKLAERHLDEGSLVLYDVSSSYYEGRSCPLAQYGHDRDGKKGLPIIVYGLMTDHQGRPIAVQVYRGNTGDPTTVGDQVNKLRERFHLSRVVLVGDRGMLTQPQINQLKARPQMGWITALTSVAIRGLLAQGSLQLSLLDEQNLVEIQSPEYPGERLMVCYNPLLAEERKRKREDLLAAADTVRGYKSLAQVERAFRSLKSLDLLIRPIRHRTAERVPAHIFLCMLAYYVEWHLRRVWAPLLFEDEELPQQRQRRDPVLPARSSESAQAKKLTHQTADGFPVQSFATLLLDLASRARVTYSLKTDKSGPTFQQVPPPTPLQAKAYELLNLLPVAGN
jgi:hypothetical protein